MLHSVIIMISMMMSLRRALLYRRIIQSRMQVGTGEGESLFSHFPIYLQMMIGSLPLYALVPHPR